MRFAVLNPVIFYLDYLQLGSIFLPSRRVSFHLTLSFQCNFVMWNDSVSWNDTLCDSKKLDPYTEMTLSREMTLFATVEKWTLTGLFWLLAGLLLSLRSDWPPRQSCMPTTTVPILESCAAHSTCIRCGLWLWFLHRRGGITRLWMQFLLFS